MNYQSNDNIHVLLQKSFGGPVPDDGFSERVMLALPTRHSRPRWLLPAAIAAGMVSCWLTLGSTSIVRLATSDWFNGHLSPTIIVLLATIVGMALLAAWWAMSEADAR